MEKFVIYCTMPNVRHRFVNKYGQECTRENAETFDTKEQGIIKMRQINDWPWAIVIPLNSINP